MINAVKHSMERRAPLSNGAPPSLPLGGIWRVIQIQNTLLPQYFLANLMFARILSSIFPLANSSHFIP